MHYWQSPFSGERGGPFQTETDAKAACITHVTKREPSKDQVDVLWASLEKTGWSVEFSL